MDQERRQDGLHPARELSEGRWPQRLVLRLGDGYETSVFVHRRNVPAPHPPVLYVHGIQSHPGWFAGSAAALADEGYEVYQVTRRGSGDNEVDRGHADSADQLLDDVEAACRFVLARGGARRLHLVGVSWGGKLLAAFAAGRTPQPRIASLTLLTPGIVPRVDVATGTKLAVAVCLAVAPRRLFDIPLNDVGLFTDNEAMRRYLRDDPLSLHRATARFLCASRRLDGIIRRAPAGAISAPTTLVLASRDRIIRNAPTRAIVDRLTAGKAVVAELQGAHTLEFESDPGPLYRTLAAAAARGA